MDDMILDMDAFDFSQIDSDLIVVHPDAPAKEEVEEEATEAVEVEETEESEEEVEETEESEEETTVVDEDGEEVDFENYEITLPSGDLVVLSDLVEGYKTAEEVRVMREEVESIKNDFEAKSGGIVSMLELAQLEVDSVIKEYEDTDWQALSVEDPASYAQHRSYLDKNVNRSKELKAAATELAEKKQAEERQIYQQKVNDGIVRLQREIPGWGPQKFNSLVEYAVSLGGDHDELMSATDPLVFLALNKAQEFEKGKQSVKAKVKRVGSPKKVVKAAPTKATVSNDTKRDAMIKKAQAEGDHATLFNLIKD
ncbi:MAG: hypothetical protein ACRC6V_05950 [Bacteroidales bacterium]